MQLTDSVKRAISRCILKSSPSARDNRANPAIGRCLCQVAHIRLATVREWGRGDSIAFISGTHILNNFVRGTADTVPLIEHLEVLGHPSSHSIYSYTATRSKIESHQLLVTMQHPEMIMKAPRVKQVSKAPDVVRSPLSTLANGPKTQSDGLPPRSPPNLDCMLVFHLHMYLRHRVHKCQLKVLSTLPVQESFYYLQKAVHKYLSAGSFLWPLKSLDHQWLLQAPDILLCYLDAHQPLQLVHLHISSNHEMMFTFFSQYKQSSAPPADDRKQKCIADEDGKMQATDVGLALKKRKGFIDKKVNFILHLKVLRAYRSHRSICSDNYFLSRDTGTGEFKVQDASRSGSFLQIAEQQERADQAEREREMARKEKEEVEVSLM
ncbi:hypothetical protein BU17DRAFT_66064 [Hysterangium stoloniferum]|nr:hypothetical protein BU17DRAFT_66064 [Hysterangium stoloniferum]